MDIKEINNRMGQFLEQQLNEMARINNTIEVNNEDTDSLPKFPHYHWLYKRSIHFKFADKLPGTINELKETIAFPKDLTKIQDKELKACLKDLKAIDKASGKIVYERAMEVWQSLHPTRDISQELIHLS